MLFNSLYTFFRMSKTVSPPIVYIEKNGFCDNQISPHFISEPFVIANPVFNLYIFWFFLTRNCHAFLCHFKLRIVVYFVKTKKRYLVVFFSLKFKRTIITHILLIILILLCLYWYVLMFHNMRSNVNQWANNVNDF